MRAAADMTRKAEESGVTGAGGTKTPASSSSSPALAAATGITPTLPPPPTLKLSPVPKTGASSFPSIPPPPPPPPTLPLAPHSSTTQIPPLPSAPPSGTNWKADFASNFPVSTTTSTATATVASLPPPPPPPPKRGIRTPPRTTSPSRAAAQPLTPTMVALPPPPPSFSSSLAAGNDDAEDDVTLHVDNTSSPQRATVVQIPPEPSQQHHQQPPRLPPSPARIVRTPPKQPDPLPYTAFLSTTGTTSGGTYTTNPGGITSNPMPPLLAHRQASFNVLVVGTESAHRLAWKNQLLLSDLLTGLMHNVTTTAGATTMPAPFRSVTRSIATMEWKDWPVTFWDGEALQPVNDEKAQALLQAAADLQPADGNLDRELDILEDQVDHLLLPTEPLSSHPLANEIGGGDESSSSWYEQRQRQLDQVTRDAFCLTSPLNLPWLKRYRQALDHVTAHQPYDLMSCPAGCLYVCTTQEFASPVEILRGLQQVPHYLPPQFHAVRGLWNPETLSKHILVLHDQVEGPKSDSWDEAALRKTLQAEFGNTSALLRINTIAPELAEQLATEETTDLWQGGGRCGNCLSVSDRVTLRNYLQQFVTSGLQPALERRLAQLNAIVSERKKGVRNVFKSFWRTTTATTSGNKASTDDDDASGGFLGAGNSGGVGSGADGSSATVRYRFDSIESQTRLLADTLFLIKDYEQALATYRLIRDDYKQDKAHAHYASCQENMALCMHHFDPYGRARDVFSCLETALLSYKKAAMEEEAALQQQRIPGQRSSVAPPSTRAATRLCLVIISVVAATTSSTSPGGGSGRHLEVADLLASASSNETALGAAVLLEQSSAHYYYDQKFRKYAFHMLMAGHMFRTAGQDPHAFRCFTSALHIYRDAQWDELHNHVRSALAAQLYGMGRFALSLQLYAKLVGCRPRVSVKSQQKFVNHVLEICNEHPKKALAGADRMVHPISTRRDRLQRITQVIQYTKTALRVLELPNMQLPFVDDETILVIAEEGGNVDHSGGSADQWGAQGGAGPSGQRATIGKVGRGDPDVWNQLMLETIAELRTASKQQQSNGGGDGNDDVVTRVLAKIEDKQVRQMIAEIDKEKAQRNLAERTKKSAHYKPSPPVRALQEPLHVEFVIRNPLGIPIDLVDLQVVATMASSADQTIVCTNQDAIQITPLASRNEQRTWTFASCGALEFSVPQFTRISQKSPGGSDDGGNSRQKWKSAYEVDPFFVVTKTGLTLQPESAQTISVSVCPLVEGDIEIIGVRCRLFDDIWIFHPFSVKGELLQNTRSNRAKRVRAESLLLKAKVERGMPCLTVDLIRPDMESSAVGSEYQPLLQGQVSKWNLRLSNVGTAPAKDIVLKTNLPWVSIWDGGDEDRASKSPEELERRTTSYSVGPSGTLLRIPVDGFGLQVDGEIQPGETVDVAVDLRTFGSGRQEFYMLFRYDLVEKTASNASFRWLKNMVEVPLYPSLTLSASIVPSYSREGEHTLSVEVTNYRSDRPDRVDLLVDQITLASRSYKLERIPGQIGVNSEGRSEVKLGWQERLTLHFRVIPLEQTSSNCLLSQSNLSGIPDSKTILIPATSSTMLSFLCLERAHGQFEETWSSHQRALARAVAAQDHEDAHPRSISAIRRANTSGLSNIDLDNDSLVDMAPTSIRKLTPPDDGLAHAILLCSWRSRDGGMEGLHYLRDLPIRPSIQEKNNAGCPIVITGSHPSVIFNNFERGPASVPLELTLQNRLVSSDPIDFEFAVEKPDDFDWTGPECFSYALAGGEKLQIPLRAILPSAGVYNIQTIRLTIEDNDETAEPVSYMFPLQWNIVAQNE